MRTGIRFLWAELRPRSRAAKREASGYGPCYDLCNCRLCWNGWRDFSLLQRLRWRIHYLAHGGYW